jgi:uncharacterized protein (DUF2141 family)
MRALLALLTLTLASPLLAQDSITLTVEVTGFRSGDGDVLITLYAAKKRWLKKHAENVRAKAAPVKGADGKLRARHTFRGLKPGLYAVGVVHDENKSGKMEMAWLPLPHPAEGIGASNNPKKGWTPPSWKESVFDLRSDLRMSIKMIHY